jgi:hypothetical protein
MPLKGDCKQGVIGAERQKRQFGKIREKSSRSFIVIPAKAGTQLAFFSGIAIETQLGPCFRRGDGYFIT